MDQIQLLETLDMPEVLAQSYVDISDVWFYKQNIYKSIENLEKAVDIYRNIDKKIELAKALTRLGDLSFEINENMALKNSYFEAISILDQTDPLNSAIAKGNLSLNLLAIKDIELANSLLSEAVVILEEYGKISLANDMRQAFSDLKNNIMM